jgi:cytochrome c biogenesis protein CcdA
MTAAAAHADARPAVKAALLTAATVWLPCALPLALGILRDSPHQVSTYVAWMPLVPGFLPAVALELDDGWFAVGAAVPTLVLCAWVYTALRTWPPALHRLVQGIVVVAVGLEALGFAYALRS